MLGTVPYAGRRNASIVDVVARARTPQAREPPPSGLTRPVFLTRSFRVSKSSQYLCKPKVAFQIFKGKLQKGQLFHNGRNGRATKERGNTWFQGHISHPISRQISARV